MNMIKQERTPQLPIDPGALRHIGFDLVKIMTNNRMIMMARMVKYPLLFRHAAPALWGRKTKGSKF